MGGHFEWNSPRKSIVSLESGGAWKNSRLKPSFIYLDCVRVYLVSPFSEVGKNYGKMGMEVDLHGALNNNSRGYIVPCLLASHHHLAMMTSNFSYRRDLCYDGLNSHT